MCLREPEFWSIQQKTAGTAFDPAYRGQSEKLTERIRKMAEIIIEPQGNIFKLKLTDDELNTIAELVILKKSNYYDVIVACFEAGLTKANYDPDFLTIPS